MKKTKKVIKKNNQENDFLDILSLRVNQFLRTEKKNKDPKNNVYFWLFKLVFLILYLYVIIVVFDWLSSFGVIAIYGLGVVLREALSMFWVGTIQTFGGLLVIYTIYKNINNFMESDYYKNLYKKDKVMELKKKNLFTVLYYVFKYLSLPYLLLMVVLAGFLMTSLVFFSYLYFKEIYLFSAFPIIIALFVLVYFLFTLIQCKFYERKLCVNSKWFIFPLSLLFIGLIGFGFEVSQFDYVSTLPENFDIVEKEVAISSEDIYKIDIKTESKYKNVQVIIDNELENEIKVKLEYFKTASPRYTYYFNNEGTLKLLFSSHMNLDYTNLEDILKYSVEAVKDRTIYNFNLFKHPTITVYVNSKIATNIFVNGTYALIES